MVSEAELLKIIKDNSSIMKENNLILQGIRDDFKGLGQKYETIGETLNRIEVFINKTITRTELLMSVTVALGIGIFLKMIFG